MICLNVPEVGARLAGGACAAAAMESASTIATNLASLVFMAVPRSGYAEGPISLTKSTFLLRLPDARNKGTHAREDFLWQSKPKSQDYTNPSGVHMADTKLVGKDYSTPE